MGISKGNVKLIMQEGSVRPYSGSILEIGVQDVVLTSHELISMLKLYGYRAPVFEVELSQNEQLKAKKFISDQYFFKSLGFENVVSLDYSNFEGCNVVYDMNLGKPPNELIDQFNVVIDGGTMEHVFNTKNFLKNIHLMCKVGGRIIHLSPSSNQINHGFYSFSPTFFLDYYQENNYIVRKCLLLRHCLDRSYCIDMLQEGANIIAELIASKHIYYNYVVVEKTNNSTYNKTPIQNVYKTIWGKQSNNLQNERKESTSLSYCIKEKLKYVLKMIGLYDVVLKFYSCIVEIPTINKYIYIKKNKIRWRRV
jgi:hypothetical protein